MHKVGFQTTYNDMAEDMSERLHEMLTSALDDVDHDAQSIIDLEQIEAILNGIIRREVQNLRRRRC